MTPYGIVLPRPIAEHPEVGELRCSYPDMGDRAVFLAVITKPRKTEHSRLFSPCPATLALVCGARDGVSPHGGGIAVGRAVAVDRRGGDPACGAGGARAGGGAGQ